MPPPTRRVFALSLAALPAAAQPPAGGKAWTPLFNGKSLEGWKEAPFPERGTVSVKDGVILLGKGLMTGIALTRPFPAVNYELRFEAARLDGADFFAGVIFPVNDTFCSWINGGWDGSTVGLSNLDGYDASENETSTNRDFAQGRWYSFQLTVTPGRIRATIDGSPVIDLDIKGRQLALRFDDTDLAKPLGFASYRTVAGLRNIAWRRIA